MTIHKAEYSPSRTFRVSMRSNGLCVLQRDTGAQGTRESDPWQPLTRPSKDREFHLRAMAVREKQESSK